MELSRKMDELARRYPIGIPAIGLGLTAVSSIILLFRDTENGMPIALITVAGALVNAWVLLHRRPHHEARRV